MKIYITTAMEDGQLAHVSAFRTKASAKREEQSWLQAAGLEVEADRWHASDWGTGFAIWTVDLEP